MPHFQLSTPFAIVRSYLLLPPLYQLRYNFYILALVFFGKKVLRILRSRGQAACLIAGLQEKTTYKSAPFSTGGDKIKDAL